MDPRFCILKMSERSELQISLQNGASFGKNQLLDWFNFGKSKQKQKGWKFQKNIFLFVIYLDRLDNDCLNH